MSKQDQTYNGDSVVVDVCRLVELLLCGRVSIRLKAWGYTGHAGEGRESIPSSVCSR